VKRQNLAGTRCRDRQFLRIAPWNFCPEPALRPRKRTLEDIMGFGKGALLWLLGIPLPIIILLALFWR
jgi:hypothetical protein